MSCSRVAAESRKSARPTVRSFAALALLVSAVPERRPSGQEAVPVAAPVPAAADTGPFSSPKPGDKAHLAALRAAGWYEQGDYDKAIAGYTEAIQSAPDRAVYYNNRAVAWLDKNDVPRAIADFNDAIRLDPDDAVAFYGRGIAQLEDRKLGPAIADFDAAIRLRRKFAAAFNNRGIARLEQGDPLRAIADFNEAIRLEPDDAAAYTNRGNARTALKDWDRALSDYAEAIALNPKGARAYGNRAELRLAQGDDAGAAADFNTAIRLDPTSARAVRGRAWIRAMSAVPELWNPVDALADAARAGALTQGRDPIDLAIEAAALASAGRFAEAATRQEEALERLPESSPLRARFRAYLELYRAGRSPRHAAARRR